MAHAFYLIGHEAEAIVEAGHRDLFGRTDEQYWRAQERCGIPRPCCTLEDALGIQLYGDEGQFYEQDSYMAISWTCECSPFYTDQALSRFVIALMPATRYYVNTSGINMTLQALLKIVVRSLNRWQCAQVVTIKGDWKFMVQCANLERHPGTNRICFRPGCFASKSLDCPYTDVSAGAAWRAAAAPVLLPWSVQPEICHLRGFDARWLSVDLLHAFHLGVGRDIASSAFVVLLRTGQFAGNNALWPQSLQTCVFFGLPSIHSVR